MQCAFKTLPSHQNVNDTHTYDCAIVETYLIGNCFVFGCNSLEVNSGNATLTFIHLFPLTQAASLTEDP